MASRVLAFLIASFVAGVCARGQIDVGSSREEVLRLFGNPNSSAQRGERELLLYPQGTRIEIIAGKVSDIRGPLPALVATPPPAAPATEPTPAPAAPPEATPADAPAPTPPAAPTTPTPKEESPLDRLAREIEKAEKAEEEAKSAPEHVFNLLALLVSFVLHFGITVFSLRLAFKYWEMDAFWTGTLAIAGIDLAVYAILELLGPVTYDISTSGAVQGGIGTLVMVPMIQRFCFNKRLQNAIVTALAVKVLVQLCHMFLFVILLNALFG